MKVVMEMAFNRTDAIDKCQRLGLQFIDHFHKIYNGDGDSFSHHCDELVNFWLEVKDIVLKNNKRLIRDDQLYDWFLTAGSSLDKKFPDKNEQILYCELCENLLDNRDLNIKDYMKNLFKV